MLTLTEYIGQWLLYHHQRQHFRGGGFSSAGLFGPLPNYNLDGEQEETARIRGLLDKYSNDGCREELRKLVEMLEDMYSEWMDMNETLTSKLAAGEPTDVELNEAATRLKEKFDTGREFVNKLPKALTSLQQLIGIMAILDEQKRHVPYQAYLNGAREAIAGAEIPEAFYWDRVLACGQREEFAEFPVKPEWMNTHLCLRLLREEIKAPAKFCVFHCLDNE